MTIPASPGASRSPARRRHATRLLALLTALTALVALAVVGAGTSATPKKQVSMTFLFSGFAQDMDPDGLPTIPQAQIFPNVYDKLYTFPSTLKDGVFVPDYKAPLDKYVGRLATAWKKDGNTFTFTLRKGVKGCTGNELTADDVVYTYARAKTRTGVVNNHSTFMRTARIFDPADTSKELTGEVVKVDKYTVRIKGTQASIITQLAFADNSYSMIFDSKLMQEKATSSDPWAHAYLRAGNSAGFGPYCVAAVDPTAQQFVLKANPGWYNAKDVQFKFVTIRTVPDASSRLEAVRAGQADGTTDLSPAQYDSLAKTQTVLTVQGSQVVWLALNYRFAPWGLPNNGFLRRAIAAALPYNTLLAGPLTGASARLQSIVPPVYNGAATFPQPNQNLTVARDLLVKAGFPEGKGLEQYKDGLKLMITDGIPFLPDLANQIRTSLAAVGIPITIETVPQSQFALRNFVRGELPMTLMVLNPNNTPDLAAAAALFFQTRPKGGANSTNYSSARVDALIPQLEAAQGAEYTKLARQMSTALWGDMPVVPIARLAQQIALKKGITGWDLRTVTPVPTFWTFKTS